MPKSARPGTIAQPSCMQFLSVAPRLAPFNYTAFSQKHICRKRHNSVHNHLYRAPIATYMYFILLWTTSIKCTCSHRQEQSTHSPYKIIIFILSATNQNATFLLFFPCKIPATTDKNKAPTALNLLSANHFQYNGETVRLRVTFLGSDVKNWYLQSDSQESNQLITWCNNHMTCNVLIVGRGPTFRSTYMYRIAGNISGHYIWRKSYKIRRKVILAKFLVLVSSCNNYIDRKACVMAKWNGGFISNLRWPWALLVVHLSYLIVHLP